MSNKLTVLSLLSSNMQTNYLRLLPDPCLQTHLKRYFSLKAGAKLLIPSCPSFPLSYAARCPLLLRRPYGLAFPDCFPAPYLGSRFDILTLHFFQATNRGVAHSGKSLSPTPAEGNKAGPRPRRGSVAERLHRAAVHAPRLVVMF